MSGILIKQNIITSYASQNKIEIIKKAGEMLENTGYVTHKYCEAMLKKEETFNTAIGFGLAIPHGIETMKNEILKSGIVVITVPQGVDWGNGQIVKLVVGIAGIGDEHMEILSSIALNCSSQQAVERLANSSKSILYDTFVTTERV